MNKKINKICATVLTTSFIIILLPLFDVGLTNCSSPECSEIGWGYSLQEFDHYDVNADHTTAGGTTYDPSGQSISPELIDRLTNEVESCLATTFNGSPLSDTIVKTSGCKDNSFQLPIDKHSFVVKIPNDWIPNCDKTEQVLPTPVLVGGAGCVAKGKDPTEQCPCRWRAGIKCPNVLITTPNFYIYKDILIRFVTECQNPWSSPELAKCATPTTTPLSDGTDPNNGINH